MRTIKLLCITLGFIYGTHSLGFDIAAVGVIDSASPSIDSAGTPAATESKFGIGFGVLASVYSIPAFTIESGLISLTRNYALSSLPAETVSMKMWQVPVLLRFDLLPIVAVGIGGYLAFASGEITKTLVIIDRTETYDANSLGKTDYGLMASASLALPILPTLKILVDARYMMGLANLSTVSGSSFKFKDLQLLAGIRLAI